MILNFNAFFLQWSEFENAVEKFWVLANFSYPLFFFSPSQFPHRRPFTPIDDGAEILSVEGGWNKSVFLDKMVPRGCIFRL